MLDLKEVARELHSLGTGLTVEEIEAALESAVLAAMEEVVEEFKSKLELEVDNGPA